MYRNFETLEMEDLLEDWDLEEFEDLGEFEDWEFMVPGSPKLLPSCRPPRTGRLLPPSIADVVLDDFQFNKTLLKPKHIRSIQRVAKNVVDSHRTSLPIVKIHFLGHTDNRGSKSVNIKVGRGRAESVRKRLEKEIDLLKPGLSSSIKFVLGSCGELKPATSKGNRTRKSRAANRRVEVFVVRKLRTKPKLPVIKPKPPRAIAQYNKQKVCEHLCTQKFRSCMKNRKSGFMSFAGCLARWENCRRKCRKRFGDG